MPLHSNQCNNWSHQERMLSNVGSILNTQDLPGKLYRNVIRDIPITEYVI